jgi:catechol 2,3-dioxygenase-like lactoylglutathione lyase family enzyme
MTLERIRAITIAVRSVDRSRGFYERVLGLEAIKEDVNARLQVRRVKYNVGDTELVLIEPTDKTSSVDRFIDKKGEGIFSLVVTLSTNGISILQERGLKSAFNSPLIAEPTEFAPPASWSKATVVWNDPHGVHVLFEFQELEYA